MTLSLLPPPHKPLPVIVKTVRDELMSSWLKRIAKFYEAREDQLMSYMGISTSGPSRVIDFDPPAAVKARLAWCLHVTPRKIANHCHTISRWWRAPIIQHALPRLFCQRCAPRWREGVPADILPRSWFENWRLHCGICKRPFHLEYRTRPLSCMKVQHAPEVPQGLWQDAVAGSALFDNFTRAIPCALLPPDVVFHLLALPVSDVGRHATQRALYLIVPEARHPRFCSKVISKMLSTTNPYHRIALLAGLARFSGNPIICFRQIYEATTNRGQSIANDLLATLPDEIADQLRHPTPKSFSPNAERYGAQMVQLHQIRLKLSDNLRQINEASLNLRLYAAQHLYNSHI